MNKNITTRLFQALSLTSFGMAVYNTRNAKKVREVEEELIQERKRSLDLQEENNQLLNKQITDLESNNELLLQSSEFDNNFNQLSTRVEDFNRLNEEISTKDQLTSEELEIKTEEIISLGEEITQLFRKGNDQWSSLNKTIRDIINSRNNSEYFDSLQQFIFNLNYEQNLAVVHISGSVFIIITLLSIVSIFYGDQLILYFKLEERFPRFAKYIQLRRKFQNYYILTSLLIIFTILIIIIFLNIEVLIDNK